MSEVEILKKLIEFQTNAEFYDNKIKEFILFILKEHIKKIEIIPNTKGRCFFVKIKKKQQSGKRPLVFLCHLDTVVPTDEWRSCPYHPIITKNKVIGLGASDMKSSVAAVMKAIISMSSIGRDVYLAFTSDEETTVNDVKKLAQVLNVKRAIVIAPEPTGGDIRIGQKGILEVRIMMPGKSSHASKATPKINKKDNAIYKMGTVIDFIKKQEQIFCNDRDNFFEPSTVNMGKISGGSMINCIADKCFLEISYRLNTITSVDKIIEALTKTLSKIDKRAKVKILLFGGSFVNINKKDTVTLKKIVSRYFKTSCCLLGKAWSEIAYLYKQGNSCFILGPGETDQAHRPNEFIKIDKLKKFCKLYSNILEEI